MSNRLRYIISEHCPWMMRSFAYKALYRQLKAEYSLERDDFAGKSVLVIGPAASAHDDLRDLDLASVDIVVKMNNGIHTQFDIDAKNPLRCDILFHSFGIGTKPVTADDLRAANVKTVVHRTLRRSAFLSTLLLEKKFRTAAKVRIVPAEKYDALSDHLGGRAPSTGMICAEFFLRSPVSRLALVGFTFFATRYVNGYDDTVTSDAIALARVEDAGHHSPLHEARLMHELVAEARAAGKNIHVSASMQRAMEFLRLRDA